MFPMHISPQTKPAPASARNGTPESTFVALFGQTDKKGNKYLLLTLEWYYPLGIDVRSLPYYTMKDWKYA